VFVGPDVTGATLFSVHFTAGVVPGECTFMTNAGFVPVTTPLTGLVIPKA